MFKPDPQKHQNTRGVSSGSNQYAWSLIRYTFWLLVLFVMVFGVGLIFFLRENPIHQMIDLRGRNIVEAMKWLQERSFRVTVSERIDPNTSRFHVIEQNPAPGVTVKENRTVSLIVSYGQYDLIMPSYQGSNYLEAYQSLLGLLSGYQVVPQITKIEKYSDRLVGEIVDHYPYSGQSINLQERFIFVVSKGIATNEIKILDYAFQNYLEVEKNLLSLGLQVRADYVATKDQRLAGKIVFQNHTQGSILFPGSSIRFTVGYYDPQGVNVPQKTDATQSLEILRNYNLIIPVLSTQDSFMERVTNQKVYLSPTNQRVRETTSLRKVRLEITDQLGSRVLVNDSYGAGKEFNFPYSSVGRGKLNIFIDDTLYESISF